jgi:hypothetical protein
MINLNEYANEVYDQVDSGCGCCSYGNVKDEIDEIEKVLARLVKEVQDSTDHSAGQ